MPCIFQRTRLSACFPRLFRMSGDLRRDEATQIILCGPLNYVLGHLE